MDPRSLLVALMLLALGAGACRSPFDQGSIPDAGTGTSDTGVGEDDASDTATVPKFSFFYTSVDAMRRLSGSENGFGGDLRFGETTGLAGADKICQTIAAGEGFGDKTWKAFLSATTGPDGVQVNAIDRIGGGPWYDRNGKLIAQNLMISEFGSFRSSGSYGPMSSIAFS